MRADSGHIIVPFPFVSIILVLLRYLLTPASYVLRLIVSGFSPAGTQLSLRFFPSRRPDQVLTACSDRLLSPFKLRLCVHIGSLVLEVSPLRLAAGAREHEFSLSLKNARLPGGARRGLDTRQAFSVPSLFPFPCFLLALFLTNIPAFLQRNLRFCPSARFARMCLSASVCGLCESVRAPPQYMWHVSTDLFLCGGESGVGASVRG